MEINSTELVQSIQSGKLKICVIGIGRIGLPLALVLADSGYFVLGVDIDKKKTDLLGKKMMPFKEDGADILLKKHFGKRFLLAKVEDLWKCDSVIISVGTLLGEDLKPIEKDVFDVLDEIIPYIKNNSLLVLMWNEMSCCPGCALLP